MTPNDIRARIRADTFVPVRVVMNSGESYEIKVAEFAVVTMSALHIFPLPKPGTDVPEGVPVVCDVRNISALVPLASQAA